jgi:hypothetical protein
VFLDSEQAARRSDATGRTRIGILTFHRCINYGSYWQARCLVEGLRQEGHDAVLLDHRCGEVDRVEWRSAMQPLLPRRSGRADVKLYARKVRRFCKAIEALPLSAPFPLSRPEEAPACDLVVVGSDEVWNFSHPWYGGRALFFGHGIRARRLVSYAASFGNFDFAAGIEPHWINQLRRFDAIAVRDDNSRRLVAEALGSAPTRVLDPCLQFPPAIEPQTAAGMQPLAVVYGHSFPDALGTAARRWADQRGLRLLSVGYRNDWADEQLLTAGPLEFARLIAGAAAVVTNFFHGCVFALLHAKPFVCAVSPYRMNKVRDLTGVLGTENRLLRNGESCRLAGLLDTPLPDTVPATLAALRRESQAYLRSILV